MGQGTLRHVGHALIAAGLLLAPTAAQGPVYRERWGYLHLEARRHEVLRELGGRDAAVHDRVAALLAAPDDGVPFTPVARALASLRGVEADAAFVLRATIGTFVLPEVSDPDGDHPACRTANVSVFLPFAVPLPGTLSFEVVVTDAAGESVWRGEITERTGERDLGMAKPAVTIPSGELPDGAYTVTTRTRIDGALPRAFDPVCTWRFHVLRGYQARADAALRAAAEREQRLGDADRVIVAGAASQVVRAFAGEPWAVRSEGVADLVRLERVLANLDAETSAASGLEGVVPLGLRLGADTTFSAHWRRGSGHGARPLVVVASGSPVFDASARRPTVPAMRDPNWLVAEFSGFAADRAWHLLLLESPGVGRDWVRGVREALAAMPALAPEGVGKVLLVAEREAAAIVALRLGELRPSLAGLVLVGAGAIPGSTLRQHTELPIRYAAARGFGETTLPPVLAFVAAEQRAGTWRGDVAWLSPQRPPWCLALPMLAPAIEAFAAELFAR